MTRKLWIKPVVEVTDMRLAQYHTFAQTDNSGALKNANNQS